MFRDRDGFRVQWQWDGKRRSRKFDSKRDAQLFEAQLKAGKIRLGERAMTPTFAEFSSLWLERHCKLEKAAGQHAADLSAITRHLLPAFEGQRMGEITKADLADFRSELRTKTARSGKPLAVKTVNLVLSLLKRIFSVAVDWDVLEVNPAATLKLFPQTEQATDHWTAAEREHFWQFARHRDRDFAELVMVACFTGLRKGELAGLERRQLDFEREMIRVDGSYCFRTGERQSRTKNGRIGYVPMGDEVLGLLARAKGMAPSQRVFELETFSHASRRLRALAKTVGVRPIRFHDLRHTFASTLVERGLPIYEVQRLMRHETPLMTQRYAHLSPEHLREAIRVISTQGAHAESEKVGVSVENR